MVKRAIAIFLVVMLACAGPQAVFAADALERGAASLLVPGLGQYLNGQHETTGGKVKMAFFALAELGAILTTSIVGANAGYPEIWSGIGIFIGNHVLSALDAYTYAKDELTIDVKGPVAR